MRIPYNWSTISIFLLFLMALTILDGFYFILKKNIKLNRLSSYIVNQNEIINSQNVKGDILKNTFLYYFNTHDGLYLRDEFYIKQLSNYPKSDSVSLTSDELPLLVFYFTNNSCNSCVNETLKLLRQYKEEYSESRVIILISKQINSDPNYVKTLMGNNIKVFIKDLSCYFFDQERSYFFLLDKKDNFKIFNCFSPIINEPDLTKAYLKSVLSTF